MRTSRKKRNLLEQAAAGIRHPDSPLHGRPDRAIVATRNAPGLPVLFAQAVALQQAADFEQAVRLYRQALSCDLEASDRGVICCNLGQALLALYRRREALESCTQAVVALPESVEAVTSMGNVLLELGRIGEARAAYERALDLNPEWLPAAHNLNTVLLEEGRFDDALAGCERVLARNPEFADARLTRGLIHLLRRDFRAGWADYDARLFVRRPATRQLGGSVPMWNGEPLNGSSILLYAEQGLGDAIQFLRYVPIVKECGGRVVLVVPASLLRLTQQLGVRTVIAGEALPACDWQCPLMSLPRALGSQTGDWTPRAWKPYLEAPEGERMRARSALLPAEKLRVGLVWAGSPDHTRDWARSMALNSLAPLLTIPHVQFYSLQTGDAAHQIEACSDRIINLAPAVQDLADTAAKLLEMDLLIAVDTSVAHLAGALGKKVWLLLTAVPDWRWQLDREDSPWYPGARLFRQQERGQWEPVIKELCAELSLLANAAFSERTMPAAGDGFATATAFHHEADDSVRIEHPGEEKPVECPLCSSGPLLSPITPPSALPCKICKAPSRLFGVVDFHKSCMEAQGKRLQLSGIPVYYRRCEQCGFLATNFFDTWMSPDFLQHIYNADYLSVDPDAGEERPTQNARLVTEAFRAAREGISILDYGGGAGKFAELLRLAGFQATTYDPFSQHCQPPKTRFDLITSFEVMEHTPDPEGTIASMASLLKTREQEGEDGLILFSTLLQPDDIEQTGLGWWYAAPRNGHCSLYTGPALARLFLSAGMQTASAGPALHLAYHRVPSFAAHLRIGQQAAPSPATVATA